MPKTQAKACATNVNTQIAAAVAQALACVAVALVVWFCGCAPRGERSGLADEIARIRAVDDHAHPVLPAPGDRDFDALPVDNMEPSSDPVYLRPGDAGAALARRTLFQTPKRQVSFPRLR